MYCLWYSVICLHLLNDTTFNLASVGDVQSLIEVIQSSYVKQIGVKHKRVIHIPAVNDLEIAALHPSDPDTLIKLGGKAGGYISRFMLTNIQRVARAQQIVKILRRMCALRQQPVNQRSDKLD